MLKQASILLLMASAMALSSCSDKQPSTSTVAQSQPAAVPASAASTPEAGVFSPGVMFEATPSAIRKCDAPNGLVAVDVKWDAAKAGTKFTSVYISDGVDPSKRTLFTSAHESGSRRTGNWVHDGSLLELQDDSTKKVLARIVFKSVDC